MFAIETSPLIVVHVPFTFGIRYQKSKCTKRAIHVSDFAVPALWMNWKQCDACLNSIVVHCSFLPLICFKLMILWWQNVRWLSFHLYTMHAVQSLFHISMFSSRLVPIWRSCCSKCMIEELGRFTVFALFRNIFCYRSHFLLLVHWSTVSSEMNTLEDCKECLDNVCEIVMIALNSSNVCNGFGIQCDDIVTDMNSIKANWMSSFRVNSLLHCYFSFVVIYKQISIASLGYSLIMLRYHWHFFHFSFAQSTFLCMFASFAGLSFAL